MEVELIAFLRLTWVAMIVPIILASVPCSNLKFFHETILGIAKRGKTMQPSSSVTKQFTVPQRFFSHFYMLGTVWTSLLLLTTWLYAFTMSPPSTATVGSTSTVWRAVFLLSLMEAQVFRRLLESLYVFNYRPSARMHIFGYLTGTSYYILAPLSLCCTCAPEMFKFTLSLVSEFLDQENKQMAAAIRTNKWESVNPFAELEWNQWVGSGIFLWGWIHQLRCHAILGSVRGYGKQANDYVIPQGDWFELVSSPHYLAEIVIYVGLVVASGGGDLTIWLLLAFVVANLGFAAAETHKWYLGKFEDYPRSRFALIPFIF